MDHADTSRLIAHCLNGDETSIERLVSHYKDGVFRLALSVLDDPAEANEAAQDGQLILIDIHDLQPFPTP